MPITVRVLVVSRPDDRHGDVVLEELQRRGVSTFRLSLNTLRTLEVNYRLGHCLELRHGNDWLQFLAPGTVWWRRPGWPELDDVGLQEQELVDAESRAFFFGALESLAVRWVDPPWKVELAERKLVQLAAAKEQGLRVPQTLVTSSSSEALRFAGQGAIVAKAMSSGRGPAPYVDQVEPTQLADLGQCPVVLQELVQAEADIRVVTVGSEVFSWRRSRRPGEPIDWRAADPRGSGFVVADLDRVSQEAMLRLTRTLGLSMSVQDWLLTDSELVFLEVNPQGQWLFLAEAQSLIVESLARFLSEETPQ